MMNITLPGQLAIQEP